MALSMSAQEAVVGGVDRNPPINSRSATWRPVMPLPPPLTRTVRRPSGTPTGGSHAGSGTSRGTMHRARGLPAPNDIRGLRLACLGFERDVVEVEVAAWWWRATPGHQVDDGQLLVEDVSWRSANGMPMATYSSATPAHAGLDDEACHRRSGRARQFTGQ